MNKSHLGAEPVKYRKDGLIHAVWKQRPAEDDPGQGGEGRKSGSGKPPLATAEDSAAQAQGTLRPCGGTRDTVWPRVGGDEKNRFLRTRANR